MATTNDLKNGMTLNLDGQLWNVIEFQHVKPGKGGAFVRTKMRSVMSGKVVEKTFNAGIKVEVASVEKRDMQYLYRDGEDFMFMDSTNYDQIRISKQTVGEAVDYLLENADAIIAKLSAEIGKQPPATAPAAQATTAPDSKKPEEVKTDGKPTEAKPASPTEFTDKEKRMAVALGAMGNEKLVGTKGIDLVRELPRINAIVTFLGSWENMARVILKRNPSLSPSMPADLGKEGVMIDKNYVNTNLKWFQVTQDTINAVYNSSEKSKGVISSIPGYEVQREESKSDDGHSKKSSYKNRSNRIGMIKEIARS